MIRPDFHHRLLARTLDFLSNLEILLFQRSPEPRDRFAAWGTKGKTLVSFVHVLCLFVVSFPHTTTTYPPTPTAVPISPNLHISYLADPTKLRLRDTEQCCLSRCSWRSSPSGTLANGFLPRGWEGIRAKKETCRETTLHIQTTYTIPPPKDSPPNKWALFKALRNSTKLLSKIPKVQYSTSEEKLANTTRGLWTRETLWPSR